MTYNNGRICPGRYLAQRIVLTISAAILSTYELVPVNADSSPSTMEFADSLVRSVVLLRVARRCQLILLSYSSDGRSIFNAGSSLVILDYKPNYGRSHLAIVVPDEDTWGELRSLQ
jgi:hypothetical protein